jgi:hypothetical protein
MPYRSDIPVDSNNVRDPVSGDMILMQTNFAILASVVSGMTVPSQGAPIEALAVTSGVKTWELGWDGNAGALTYTGVVVAVANAGAWTFKTVQVGSDTAPTADTHFLRIGDMASPKHLVEVLGGHIVSVTSGAVFGLDERAMYGYEVRELHAQTASGSAVITVKIGAATVSGLDGVTISGTQTSNDASAAFTVVSGNRLTLTVDSVLGDPSDLSFTFKVVRT